MKLSRAITNGKGYTSSTLVIGTGKESQHDITGTDFGILKQLFIESLDAIGDDLPMVKASYRKNAFNLDPSNGARLFRLEVLNATPDKLSLRLLRGVLYSYQSPNDMDTSLSVICRMLGIETTFEQV